MTLGKSLYVKILWNCGIIGDESQQLQSLRVSVLWETGTIGQCHSVCSLNLKILPSLCTLAFTLFQKGFSLDWNCYYWTKFLTKPLQRELASHVPSAPGFPIDPWFSPLEPGQQEPFIEKAECYFVAGKRGFVQPQCSYSSAESSQKMACESLGPKCYIKGSHCFPSLLQGPLYKSISSRQPQINLMKYALLRSRFINMHTFEGRACRVLDTYILKHKKINCIHFLK